MDEQQVPRCAQNDNQKSKVNGKRASAKAQKAQLVAAPLRDKGVVGLERAHVVEELLVVAGLA